MQGVERVASGNAQSSLGLATKGATFELALTCMGCIGVDLSALVKALLRAAKDSRMRPARGWNVFLGPFFVIPRGSPFK